MHRYHCIYLTADLGLGARWCVAVILRLRRSETPHTAQICLAAARNGDVAVTAQLDQLYCVLGHYLAFDPRPLPIIHHRYRLYATCSFDWKARDRSMESGSLWRRDQHRCACLLRVAQRFLGLPGLLTSDRHHNELGLAHQRAGKDGHPASIAYAFANRATGLDLRDCLLVLATEDLEGPRRRCDRQGGKSSRVYASNTVIL